MLTRRIPIRNRIFTTSDLAVLLKQLAGYYQKSKREYRENTFRLSISEDAHTTTSVDSPPKSFEPLLNSSIHHLRLRISCDVPDRDVEFTISPGANSWTNCIELQSEDEDWVNLAYNNISKLLTKVRQQSTFIKRHGIWLSPLLAVLIGWPIAQLFYFLLLKFGEAHEVHWNWATFGQHIFFSEIFGILPANMLFSYATERGFPGIEFQTGPSHTWKEFELRRKLNFLFGVLILGPLGSLIYEIYKGLADH